MLIHGGSSTNLIYTVIETISKTIVFIFRIIQRTVNTVITLKVSENYSMLFSQQLNDNNNDKHHQEHITAPEDDLCGVLRERERRWSNVCEAVESENKMVVTRWTERVMSEVQVQVVMV